MRAEAVDVVLELTQQRKVELEIAETYPLERVADAIRHNQTERVRGKIVLQP